MEKENKHALAIFEQLKEYYRVELCPRAEYTAVTFLLNELLTPDKQEALDETAMSFICGNKEPTVYFAGQLRPHLPKSKKNAILALANDLSREAYFLKFIVKNDSDPDIYTICAMYSLSFQTNIDIGQTALDIIYDLQTTLRELWPRIEAVYEE